MGNNRVSISMAGVSANESFARVAVSGFIAALDPTYDELSDIKTAVSEAVTNAIIHGYGDGSEGEIHILLTRDNRTVTIEITDNGAGISNVDEARAPLFTTKPELERSGMGFTVMETFMERVEVRSKPGEGTTVTMVKTLKG
jgi:stage II sporulation protein AB (anti-sigma F factor)